MISVTISTSFITTLKKWLTQKPVWWFLIVMATALSVTAISFSLTNDFIVTYGDAESHLNISKRVIHSLTPGFAQLGGIWLPMPHVLMLPFVSFDTLWRTGLAGSIVSATAFVVTTLYLYRFGMLIAHSRIAGVIAAVVFMTNPNILYMQSTPMTELLLICFFVLSSYYYAKFLQNTQIVYPIILAALFGFCAVLSRYDGWFLVVFEAAGLGWLLLTKRLTWKKAQGVIVLFSTLAFFGVFLWLLWDFLILGDALYFTHSEFSARAQQEIWQQKGQLPAYHSPVLAFLYYFVTAMTNAGLLIFTAALLGLWIYLSDKAQTNRFLITVIFTVPFIFYFFTLFIGQSVIFIPHLTPISFEWRLFNVRYGVMMIPAVAFFFSFLFHKLRTKGRIVLVSLMLMQMLLFAVGYSKIITFADGVEGLSSAKRPDAEQWLTKNYDWGLVLMDDYSRITSIVRSGIPMQNIIYIGNRPYWQESLETPEKHATWVITQKGDVLWDEFIEDPNQQHRIYSHFEKVYTSPDILIFRKPKV